MKRQLIPIVAIVLCIVVIILSWLGRRNSLNSHTEYDAAHYYAHIQALDSDTSEVIEFDLSWDVEGLSPYSKGSGPTVIEKLSDGTVIFSLVGLNRPEPIRVEVLATGYQSTFIEVKANTGGILTQDSSRLMRIVPLKSAVDEESH